MFTKNTLKKLNSILKKKFTKLNTNIITNSITQNTKINLPTRTIDYFLEPEKFTFFDNTNFIKNILSNTNTEIIYQPESYGKTFNLEILRYFLSNNNKLDNILSIKKREEFFEDKKIFENKDLKEKFFGKYPIVYINFKELNERNFNDNIEKLKFLLNTQISQIFESDDFKILNSLEVKIFEDFFENHKKIDLNFISILPKMLSNILGKLSNKSPFVLFNNFDYPLINSYGNTSHETYKIFLENLIRNTFKDNQYIYKGILTGVNDIEINHLFSSIKNLKLTSFKLNENNNNNNNNNPNNNNININTNNTYIDNNNEELNKYFGIDLNNYNENIFKENLKAFIPKNSYAYGNKNISFFNFEKTYNFDLNKITENYLNNTNNNNNDNENQEEEKENLINELLKNLKNKTTSEDLNLETLFSNMVNNSSKDYLMGYKILNLLNNKAENFIENFFKKNSTKKLNAYYDKNFNFNLTKNSGFDLDRPLKTENLLNFLCSNNIIQINEENNLTIPHLSSALLISETFKKLNFHNDDYNRNLAYLFYKYLYYNKTKTYLSEIKKIFDSSRKQSKNISLFSKPGNLIFKNEKDMENYFVHIFTLELNLENSMENINIYQIDDDENLIISDSLKQFVLITYDDRKFATFVKFNKYRTPTSQAAEELMEIDEIQKNSVIQKAANRKLIGIKPEDAEKNLKEINMEVMNQLKDMEMINFLRKISDNFEAFNVISISSFGKYMDYEIREVLIGN
jgi:hypothetical protein